MMQTFMRSGENACCTCQPPLKPFGKAMMVITGFSDEGQHPFSQRVACSSWQDPSMITGCLGPAARERLHSRIREGLKRLSRCKRGGGVGGSNGKVMLGISV